jgi:succinate-acetate transporter protein
MEIMVQKKELNSMEEKSVIHTEATVRAWPVAEPAALGLFGLAVAALVLASTDLKLALSTAKSLMIPWVLFFGATAQLVAGTMEFKRNNIFGATVFSVYAMTMYAIALTLFITIFTGVFFDITHYAYGLIGILVFSIIATVASVMTNKTFFAILIAVDLAVVLLIPHYLFEVSAQPAGVFLLLTSVLSFYGAAAILLNTMAGKTILPLGKALWVPVKK